MRGFENEKRMAQLFGSKVNEGSIATSEVARNIRRNIQLIHSELRPGDDRDSSLIDLINHIDALAQQIEYDNTGEMPLPEWPIDT